MAFGSLNLEDAFLDGKQRQVEGATTQVEDKDVLLTLGSLVEALGEGCSFWLVDAALDTNFYFSLAMRVIVIVGDNSSSGVGAHTIVKLCDLLHHSQDHRRDLLGHVFLCSPL